MAENMKSTQSGKGAAQPKAASYDMFESLERARNKAKQSQSRPRGGRSP